MIRMFKWTAVTLFCNNLTVYITMYEHTEVSSLFCMLLNKNTLDAKKCKANKKQHCFDIS